MQLINRMLAIVRPKQPFLDWFQACPDPPGNVTLEELRREATAFLIPEFLETGQAQKHVRKIHQRIFEELLDGWYRDPDLWPAERGYIEFKAWFDVEIYEMVLDTVDERILKTPELW
jgi:hypothetical protein